MVSPIDLATFQVPPPEIPVFNDVNIQIRKHEIEVKSEEIQWLRSILLQLPVNDPKCCSFKNQLGNQLWSIDIMIDVLQNRCSHKHLEVVGETLIMCSDCQSIFTESHPESVTYEEVEELLRSDNKLSPVDAKRIRSFLTDAKEALEEELRDVERRRDANYRLFNRFRVLCPHKSTTHNAYGHTVCIVCNTEVEFIGQPN